MGENGDAASGLGGESTTLHRTSLPPPAFVGAKVAVIAPAGPIRDSARLEANLEVLRGWGLVPVILDDSIAERSATAAASFLRGKFNCTVPDTARVDALSKAFASDEFAAVICAKGGYGAMRLLQHFDWSRLINHLPKKRFFGFSDITALHNAFAAEVWTRSENQSRFVSFSSPMPGTQLWESSSPEDLERLKQAMFGPRLCDAFAPILGRRLYGGCSSSVATGTLVGGNLSLVAATTGTRWAMLADADLRMKPFVLALEDVGESAYRIDRMMQQLRLAGVLDAAAAILIGDFEADGPPGGQFAEFEGNPVGVSAEEFFWREVVQLPTSIPVLVNCPFGHGARNVTLPFGAMVEIDGEQIRVASGSAGTATEGS